MKNIILSTDGTGNAGGKGHGTNVWRLHTAIDRHGTNIPEQIAFYHDGVGSQNNKFLKTIGGALGWGLKRTILELYFDLVSNYSEGDQIYLFGFSRGAYTVRLLAGFITSCGIIKRDDYSDKSDIEIHAEIDLAYSAYKDLLTYNKQYKNLENAQKERDINTIRNRLKPNRYTDVRIRFIGVWDTVDAYAIPFDSIARLFDRFLYTSFREHDNSLSKKVEMACHALSIDDQRRTFLPVLWREDTPEDEKRIQQVWFCGVHSNVGGGYPKQGLAWVTLEWMLLHAKAAGLHFVHEDIEQFSENKNIHDKLYDSRSGLGAYYAFRIRKIEELWTTYVSNSSAPSIHKSTFERIARRSESYSPTNLPSGFKIVDTESVGQLSRPEEFKTLQGKISGNMKDYKSLLDSGRYQNIALTQRITKWIDHYYTPILTALVLIIFAFCCYDNSADTYFRLSCNLTVPSGVILLSAIVLSLISSKHKKDLLHIGSRYWRRVIDQDIYGLLGKKGKES